MKALSSASVLYSAVLLSVRTIGGALILFGLCLVVAGSSSAGERGPRVQPRFGSAIEWWRWQLHTQQNPPSAHSNQPPPALQPYLPRFVARYTVWSALDGKKPTFGAWLLVIGVIDPVEHQAMVQLHAWALRNRLVAE